MKPNSAHTGMTICGHSYGEYRDRVKSFHGHVAPGMILGGFLVDFAVQHRPEGEFFDTICETRACLPDAVQLLTPCTVGNSWLKIVDLGRFALAFFEKYSGIGVRAYVDSKKVNDWPLIKAFLFKLKAKQEQDSGALIQEMEMAGTSVFSFQNITVDISAFQTSRRRTFAVCPRCGEGYPKADGDICLGCQGQAPYLPAM